MTQEPNGLVFVFLVVRDGVVVVNLYPVNVDAFHD